MALWSSCVVAESTTGTWSCVELPMCQSPQTCLYTWLAISCVLLWDLCVGVGIIFFILFLSFFLLIFFCFGLSVCLNSSSSSLIFSVFVSFLLFFSCFKYHSLFFVLFFWSSSLTSLHHCHYHHFSRILLWSHTVPTWVSNQKSVSIVAGLTLTPACTSAPWRTRKMTSWSLSTPSKTKREGNQVSLLAASKTVAYASDGCSPVQRWEKSPRLLE